MKAWNDLSDCNPDFVVDESSLDAGVYVVATPLGNLGDLSYRAREILSRASFLAAENIAVGRRWLEILGKEQAPNWKRPHLLSYRESSRESDARKILELLETSESVALVSDAGTPGVSDPGWHLVDEVRQAGFPVWAIPGSCAAVAALSISGFPSRRFSFEGFLPPSGRHRREALERLSECANPCILYESPHKFLKTLDDLAELFPERELFVSREMTKKFEESWRGTLAEARLVWPDKTVKGEFTLVLGPRTSESRLEDTEIPLESLEFMRELRLPTKSATAILKHFFPKASKKAIYKELSQS